MSNRENEIDYRGLFWFMAVLALVGICCLCATIVMNWNTLASVQTSQLMVVWFLLTTTGVGWACMASDRKKLLALRREHADQSKWAKDYGALLYELVDQSLIDRLLGDWARKLAEAEEAVRDFPDAWAARPGVKTESGFDREYEALKEKRFRTNQRFGRVVELVGRVRYGLGTNWRVHPKEEYLKEDQKQVS